MKAADGPTERGSKKKLETEMKRNEVRQWQSESGGEGGGRSWLPSERVCLCGCLD